mmetsp:Transcript_2177/g.7272  ORF Transcript_2177/g.7272 Transcript_2177/m.7272 type:complete len:286 (+) Transcript_2177:148-1005(+)
MGFPRPVALLRIPPIAPLFPVPVHVPAPCVLLELALWAQVVLPTAGRLGQDMVAAELEAAARRGQQFAEPAVARVQAGPERPDLLFEKQIALADGKRRGRQSGSHGLCGDPGGICGRAFHVRAAATYFHHQPLYELQAVVHLLHLAVVLRPPSVQKHPEVNEVLDGGRVCSTELEGELDEVGDRKLPLELAAHAVALKNHVGKVNEPSDINASGLQVVGRGLVFQDLQKLILRDVPISIHVEPALLEHRQNLLRHQRFREHLLLHGRDAAHNLAEHTYEHIEDDQ